jgi:hypothetical protein
MLKYLSMLVTSLLLMQTLAAAPYTMDDFAFSATLSDAKTSLRQVDIPELLYEKIQRKDFADLRVFSADGQIVPHQFSRPESIDSTRQVPLVFYPFNKEQAADPGNIRVIINQQEDKQSLSINQQLGNTATASNTEYQYIIENPKTTSALCKMKLDWDQTKSSLILPLKLESSNNLQNWRTLSRDLNISKLDYAGSQLIRDEISIPCTRQKYLRLSWLKPEQQTHLKLIQGIYTQNGAPQTQWKSFGKPQYDKEGNWLFESNIVAAITQMEFVAPQDGLLYKGMLYSRNDEKQDWRFRQNVSQYRLNIGEANLRSDAFLLRSNNDRYWKLAIETEGRLNENQLPEIRAGWAPKQLLFLAQGAAPFTLAFGNPTISPANSNDLNSLIKTYKDSGASVDKVTLGSIIENEKYVAAKSKLPWKKILLWLVLIMGTALMGFMAYRLYQQMGNEMHE